MEELGQYIIWTETTVIIIFPKVLKNPYAIEIICETFYENKSCILIYKLSDQENQPLVKEFNSISVLAHLRYRSILYHSILVFLDQFHEVTYSII